MEQWEYLINAAWENWPDKSVPLSEETSRIIEQIIALLDKGALRVAEKVQGTWRTHEWIKKAILLYIRFRQCEVMGGKFQSQSTEYFSPFFDKIPLKCTGWTEKDFVAAGFRAVPGSIIRLSSFVSKNVVLMPSFVNVGAYVGANTLVDTWVTIGSCAQIGANCHISGGVGIGGVLEPLQASPVIIEDNCFIGARSEIVEGVIVEEGAVISMGVFIGSSTKIVHRQTGDIIYGRVPAYSVVVPGTLPSVDPLKPSLSCAVIIKQVDEKTRLKTSINELLRG
jgi:2,3,4,5-tetrahydropyridine-2-carboxylate N-succinyltransferase